MSGPLKDKFMSVWLVVLVVWRHGRTGVSSVVNICNFSDPGSVGAGGLQRLLPDPNGPWAPGPGREDQTGRRSKWEIQT